MEAKNDDQSFYYDTMLNNGYLAAVSDCLLL